MSLRPLLLSIASISLLLAAGCRTLSGGSCHKPQSYENAQAYPPLRVPAGLDGPKTDGALEIPVVNEPEPPVGRKSGDLLQARSVPIGIVALQDAPKWRCLQWGIERVRRRPEALERGSGQFLAACCALAGRLLEQAGRQPGNQRIHELEQLVAVTVSVPAARTESGKAEDGH